MGNKELGQKRGGEMQKSAQILGSAAAETAHVGLASSLIGKLQLNIHRFNFDLTC